MNSERTLGRNKKQMQKLFNLKELKTYSMVSKLGIGSCTYLHDLGLGSCLKINSYYNKNHK